MNIFVLLKFVNIEVKMKNKTKTKNLKQETKNIKKINNMKKLKIFLLYGVFFLSKFTNTSIYIVIYQ